MPGTVLFNGEATEPGLTADRAFQFGDGLFETVAIHDGQLCLWHRHLQRLQAGCERLKIPLPAADLLTAEAQQLATGQRDGVLKVIISAGSGGRGYARPATVQPNRYLSVNPWPDQPQYQDSGLPLVVQWCKTRLADQPLLAGIKHLNRLEQVLARAELSPGVDEGLLCDQQGAVIEGVSCNVLMRYGQTYVTPRLDRCGVAGVVRQLIIDVLKQQGLLVRESRLPAADLDRADGLYLCNSLLGIRAVKQVHEQHFAATDLPEILQRVHAACFTFAGEV